MGVDEICLTLTIFQKLWFPGLVHGANPLQILNEGPGHRTCPKNSSFQETSIIWRDNSRGLVPSVETSLNSGYKMWSLHLDFVDDSGRRSPRDHPCSNSRELSHRVCRPLNPTTTQVSTHGDLRVAGGLVMAAWVE